MKPKMIFVMMLFFLIALGVGPSMAGHGHGGCANFFKGMSEMDANQDDLLTVDEFGAPHMEMVRGVFKMLDTNNDEVISKTEYDEFMTVHGYGSMNDDKELVQ